MEKKIDGTFRTWEVCHSMVGTLHMRVGVAGDMRHRASMQFEAAWACKDFEHRIVLLRTTLYKDQRGPRGGEDRKCARRQRPELG